MRARYARRGSSRSRGAWRWGPPFSSTRGRPRRASGGSSPNGRGRGNSTPVWWTSWPRCGCTTVDSGRSTWNTSTATAPRAARRPGGPDVESFLKPDLTGRRVLLAVSGGVAAYKAAELCRLLVRCGGAVQVMMTDAARAFVGEATFAALSGRQVATGLFDPQQESQIGHIRLADEAELLVCAPTTADLLARLAHGLAGDLVGTVYLAYAGPVLLAPAMNVRMWEHPATQANVETLVRRGHRFVGPSRGEMACGHTGPGRMAEPEEILQAVGACLAGDDLRGRRILVSAGGTREPLDPVRYLGNRSSGRMGFALAAEASARGAEVVLVAGPSSLPTPYGVQRVEVESAAEMARAVFHHAAGADAVIMAAAVADFRPVERAERKVKKKDVGSSWTLSLEPTTDILGELGAREGRRPLLVGFAAETGPELEAYASAKLAAKGCDLLVANDVLQPGSGFESETNQAVILGREGLREVMALLEKRQLAARILDRVVRGLAR
ncbi:MAG: bifunctional phosphopantothenoylcysteine decarboxylase/phosphopantothenate--cysteine ligase CoaBC [Deltaproteobacteria bacterium]|nr:bifunctional phosphopantothenoylcysteine decarboxylase/phosphopantothenate--cysteine ligase CoaBC [Deltaproteobacteria bacterium]